jgi:hypothetical protein
MDDYLLPNEVLRYAMNIMRRRRKVDFCNDLV